MSAGRPDGIEDHHVHGGGRLGLALRWAWMALVVAVLVAALAGLFGQTERSRAAEGPGARLEMEVPSVVRGGVLFQTRIAVVARRDIEHPRLVLDEGWLDGLQINSIEPAPESEASRDGRLVLSYAAMKPGDRLLVSMHFQAEPTRVGITTDNDVELDDGETALLAVAHRLRRMP